MCWRRLTSSVQSKTPSRWRCLKSNSIGEKQISKFFTSCILAAGRGDRQWMFSIQKWYRLLWSHAEPSSLYRHLIISPVSSFYEYQTCTLVSASLYEWSGYECQKSWPVFPAQDEKELLYCHQEHGIWCYTVHCRPSRRRIRCLACFGLSLPPSCVWRFPTN